MCGVGPPWSLRRHPSEAPSRSCDVRCVPPGAPPEALKLAAVSRGTNTNYRPTDHVRMHMIKRGLAYPGACGAHSYFCIGVQCRG
eukprot:COSAG01_NODE_2386_length_7787_cov_13.747789_5_plen_85_part_00